MGIIQGFLFGFIILFSKKLNNKTNIYLSFTSFSLSVSNLQYWLIDIELNKFYPFLDWLRIPTEFLIIPMFYIFILKYLENILNLKIKILLCLPFIFSTLFQSIYFFDKIFKLDLINETYSKHYFVIEEFCSFSISIFLLTKIFLVLNKVKKDYDFDKISIQTKWITEILFIGVTGCFLWLVSIYFMNRINIFSYSKYYPIWIFISFIIYFLSYSGLINSIIANDRKKIRYNRQSQNPILEFKSGKTYSVFEEFQSYIKQNFQNPNLSLEFVSSEINVSTSYLSQIINSNNIKFNDYVNLLRVEEAIKILTNDDYDNYNITSIGFEAGFNSNASFYRAFKKHTGKSPKEYRIKVVS